MTSLVKIKETVFTPFLFVFSLINFNYTASSENKKSVYMSQVKSNVAVVSMMDLHIETILSIVNKTFIKDRRTGNHFTKALTQKVKLHIYILDLDNFKQLIVSKQRLSNFAKSI